MFDDNFFFKKQEKKFQSALFSPRGRWTGNNLLFKGGLMLHVVYQLNISGKKSTRGWQYWKSTESTSSYNVIHQWS